MSNAAVKSRLAKTMHFPLSIELRTSLLTFNTAVSVECDALDMQIEMDHVSYCLICVASIYKPRLFR